MDKLTIEEKAKRYDEAIKRAKAMIPVAANQEEIYNSIITIFPELKESEDEKIRQLLLRFVKYDMSDNYSDDFTPADCVAWLEKQCDSNKEYWRGYREGKKEILDKYSELEKQGEQILANSAKTCKDEQNPGDKVEPKFHKGDWVVYTGYLLKDSGKEIYVMQVASVENDRYNFTDTSTLCFDSEKDMRLWTIQDAKDGDVLVSESTCGLGTWYCIFKSLDGDESMTVYCYLARDGRFETKKELCFDKDPYNTKPATKEQRDQLEKAMADAGYEWNAEKKELKKVEQKSAWSEEDDIKALNRISTILVDASEVKNWWKEYRLIERDEMIRLTDFLKSLKDRVQPQPKQEWSEEDEERLSDAIFFVREYQIPTRDKRLLNAAKEAEDWLKSLKPQKQWKPSEEQMDALESAIVDSISSIQKHSLESLYNELKKL